MLLEGDDKSNQWQIREVKLPNHKQATIPEAKIRNYLLSSTHPIGRGKSEFFVRFGFSLDQWILLANALLLHASENDISNIEESPFGVRYIIEGTLSTPDNRNPVIRSVWFIDEQDEVPRFVTAYPINKRRGEER